MLTFQLNRAAERRKCNPEPVVMGEASNDTNYIIVNQNDIGEKLKLLFTGNTLLAIQVPGKFSTSTLLTTITCIEGGYIFLGGFQNERFNKDLLMQSSLLVIADFEGIAVSFALSELSGHDIDAAFNLRARIPQRLEWVQRRNARRVKVPINIPVKIQYKNQVDYFGVTDISVAGLSYLAQIEDHCSVAVGDVHTDCNIILPDNSVYLANFEIVNSVTIPYQRTKQINRVGCELKRASYQLDTALQRLINQIDFFYQ